MPPSQSALLSGIQRHADACLPPPSLLRCYASLSPSPAVRRLIAAEDIRRVAKTLAVYIEVRHRPFGVPIMPLIQYPLALSPAFSTLRQCLCLPTASVLSRLGY